MTDRELGKPQLRQRAAQLPQRRNTGLALGNFAEGLVLQVKLPARQSRPGDALASEVALETLLPERCPVIHAIVLIDVGDERRLDVLPLRLQQREGRNIDRDTAPLDRRRRLHEAPPQQRPREIDLERHTGEELRQRVDVALAVVEDPGPLLLAPRPAAHDELAACFLLVGADVIEPIIDERPELTAAGRERDAVCEVPELREAIDEIRRQRPVQREMGAAFGRGIKRDVEALRVGPERRQSRELAPPLPHQAPRSELASQRRKPDRDARRPGRRTPCRRSRPL